MRWSVHPGYSRTFAVLLLVAGVVGFAGISGCGGDDAATESSNPGNGDTTGGTTPPVVGGNAKLYVFGDSLSDAGNLGAAFPNDLPAPFYMNRISNGPVIVDHIAQSRGLTLEHSNYLSVDERGTNYASSGARALGSSPIDLGVEVQSFALKNDGIANPQDNYIVFIGGNDILGAVGAPTPNADLDSAIAAIIQEVRKLAALGARNLFVFNAPDIGSTPKLRLEAAVAGDDRLARATALSVYFNAQLAAAVAGVTLPDVRVTLVDVFSVFTDLLANAAAAGFTNATDACYLTAEFRFNDTCNETLLEGFVFFDDIHPSGKTHRLIGEEVARRIGPLLN